MKEPSRALSSVRLAIPIALSLVGSMVAPLAAQCGDPAPPAGGFAITELLGSPVTYGDGAQTRIDVRYPSAAPGRCGWPVVILVHPLGATRSLMAADARSLSAQGYYTAAYDVRGQGAAFANPASQGMDWFGENVRLDLAQVVHHVRDVHGGTAADVDRLGITGLSQGGVHAWIAAAWSGKPLPPNARGITTFPTFRAAVPAWAPPVDASFFDPRATSPWVVRSHAQPAANGVRWQTSYLTAVNSALANEDFAALHAMVQNDPWRADVASLASSTLPVLAHVSWNDSLFAADDLLRAFAVVPASTPKRRHGPPAQQPRGPVLPVTAGEIRCRVREIALHHPCLLEHRPAARAGPRHDAALATRRAAGLPREEARTDR